MCAIPERLRGVFTTRRYTNPRLPSPYLTKFVTKHVYVVRTFFRLLCSAVTVFSVWVLRVKLSPLGGDKLHKPRHGDLWVLLEHHRPHVVGVQLVACPLTIVLLCVVDVHVVQAMLCTDVVGCQLQMT